MNTTDEKVTQLLEKFQEVYNMFTDLQEELKNKESETLLEYDQLVDIVEEVIDSLEGESVQLNEYELSMNYDNQVELENAYIDASESFSTTSIVNTLTRFIKKKEYLVGYTIKTSGEDTSKEDSHFKRVSATNSCDATKIVRNKLADEIWSYNNQTEGDIPNTYLDTGKIHHSHTKVEIVKVAILEDTDTEIGLDAVSVE